MNRFVGFFSWVLVFILATSNMGIASAAAGTEIEVTTTADTLSADELCSLREAIQAVNSGASVDACVFNGSTVIHLPVGEYILAIAGASEDANASGDLDLLTGMTLRGTGAAQTVINGSQLDRVLQVHPGVMVVVDGVTIRTGLAAKGADHELYGDDGQNGGGIANAGTLILQNSVVSGNQAGAGGRGLTEDSDALEQGGHGGDGGGIFNSGVLVLQHSKVLGNSAGAPGFSGCTTPARGGQGGGIFNSGDLVITDSLVQGNVTGNGGSSFCPPTSFSGSGGIGGGIYNSGSLTLRASTVANNQTSGGYPGGNGGGLLNIGIASLTNATFSANQTGGGGSAVSHYIWPARGGDGGAIYNSGSVTANNLTVSMNLTGKGGAGYFTLPPARDGQGGGIATTGQFLLRNSILANPGTGADCTTGIESRGYNLVLQADGCGFTGNLTGNQIGVEARLLPLGDFGGFTPVMLPHPGPAINAGSCTDIAGNPITVDQRGVARPQGTGCDIGAVEAVWNWTFLPVVGR